MRDLKFRVWDKKNKKWIDDSDIAINQQGLFFIRYEGQISFNPISLTKSQNYKIVFFTGLKDKNGKKELEDSPFFTGKRRGEAAKQNWTDTIDKDRKLLDAQEIKNEIKAD